jgi:exopolysaccharide biosynthesis polyprenyl glycosylphosphotransferase
MLKEQQQVIYRIAIVLDCIVVGIAFLLAHILRVKLEYLNLPALISVQKGFSFQTYAWTMAIVIPLWIICLKHFGAYHSMRKKNFIDLFWNIFDGSILAILSFSAIAFLLKLDLLSRAFVIILFVSVVFLLSVEKWAGLAALRYIRRHGYNYRMLLIAGSGKRAENFAQMVNDNPQWGLKILGFVDKEDRVGMEIANKKVIGSFNDVARILDENVVDDVVFILPMSLLPYVRDCVKICEKVGVRSNIAVDFFDTTIAKPSIEEVEDWPLLTFDTISLNATSLFIKRLIDIVLSASGLILLAPLFLITALAIKMTSKGPVFFKQIRSGLHGRTFEIYKFRTMGVGAEERLEELMSLNEREGPVFKIRNDPRITKIGGFLRKVSLDELPQLINVLKGDMSLVGPRPPLPSEVTQYERWQRRRLSLRPGITCIHEVVAREDIDFDRWMKLDLEYIDNWSITLDIKILTRTIFAVFKGTGS